MSQPMRFVSLWANSCQQVVSYSREIFGAMWDFCPQAVHDGMVHRKVLSPGNLTVNQWGPHVTSTGQSMRSTRYLYRSTNEVYMLPTQANQWGPCVTYTGQSMRPTCYLYRSINDTYTGQSMRSMCYLTSLHDYRWVLISLSSWISWKNIFLLLDCYSL